MSAGESGDRGRRRSGVRNRLRRLGYALAGERRPRENRYRDVLILVAFGMMVWGGLIATTATHTASRATHDASAALVGVQQGRATSISLTCSALSAVVVAGRDVISGPALLRETPFDRALEQLGYPPHARRIKAARRAARLYVQHIVDSVAQALRANGKSVPVSRLVRADGSLDCRTFLALSRAPTR